MTAKIIHNLALGAVLVALVASLWQDWGTLTTIKRMFISYLSFFFLGAVMVLAVKLVGALEKDHPDKTDTGSEKASRTG